MMRATARLLFSLGVMLACLCAAPAAEAQYKNTQFGFEAGWFFVGKDSGLAPANNLSFGLRGGYKSADRWWFTARAHLAFTGDVSPRDNSVVLMHLVPVDVRYYFQTDAFRPFVGLTNSFQILFNQDIESDAFWGPGVTAGMELKLQRDIYLGFQVDAYWMFVFQGADAPLATATTQLIFFL
ncbi:outer membrane beta-barrel protein [Myxococcota bacterium]|nr:outer membrane beta-barrel protein [Myxococcota bacterium]